MNSMFYIKNKTIKQGIKNERTGKNFPPNLAQMNYRIDKKSLEIHSVRQCLTNIDFSIVMPLKLL